jgi:multiple sugar transport system permease protein
MASAAHLTTTPGSRERARRWLGGFRERETWAAFAFLSPWIVGFVIFTAGPMVASAVLSFTDYSIIQTTHDVGLANYRQLYHDPYVSNALKVTMIFLVMSVPLHMAVSLGLAMLLKKVGKAGSLFRTIFYIPVMTPAVAVGILYLFLFNGDYGLINQVLGWFHIKGPYWTSDPNWMKPSLVFMGAWQVGAGVVILLAALSGVPQQLYEAAEIDGASRWRRFKDVTLPMISPTLFFLMIIGTISALQTFEQVYVAFFNAGTSSFGTDAVRFYVIYLFQEAFVYFHLGYASALAWVLFGIIMVVTGIQMLGSRRFVYYEGNQR